MASRLLRGRPPAVTTRSWASAVWKVRRMCFCSTAPLSPQSSGRPKASVGTKRNFFRCKSETLAWGLCARCRETSQAAAAAKEALEALRSLARLKR